MAKRKGFTPKEAAAYTGFSSATFYVWLWEEWCPILNRKLRTVPADRHLIVTSDVKELRRRRAAMPSLEQGRYINSRGTWLTLARVVVEYGWERRTVHRWGSLGCPALPEGRKVETDEVWFVSQDGRPGKATVYLERDLETIKAACGAAEREYITGTEALREFRQHKLAASTLRYLARSPLPELGGRPVDSDRRLRRYPNGNWGRPTVFSRSDLLAYFAARQSSKAAPSGLGPEWFLPRTIAKIHRCSEKTIRNRLHSNTGKLRETLNLNWGLALNARGRRQLQLHVHRDSVPELIRKRKPGRPHSTDGGLAQLGNHPGNGSVASSDGLTAHANGQHSGSGSNNTPQPRRRGRPRNPKIALRDERLRELQKLHSTGRDWARLRDVGNSDPVIAALDLGKSLTRDDVRNVIEPPKRRAKPRGTNSLN